MIKETIIGMLLTLSYASPSLAEPPKRSAFIEDPDVYIAQETAPLKVNKKKEAELRKFVENVDFYLTGPSEQYKLQQGEIIKGILEDECDSVESYLREFPDGKDLIIICYENGVAEWAMNLDNVCRTYAEVTTFAGIDISGLFVTELSRGEINSKKVSVGAAKSVVSIVGDYLHKYNDQRCTHWKDFIHQYHGPFGPAINK